MSEKKVRVKSDKPKAVKITEAKVRDVLDQFKQGKTVNVIVMTTGLTMSQVRGARIALKKRGVQLPELARVRSSVFDRVADEEKGK